jgi:hypothetical protein
MCLQCLQTYDCFTNDFANHVSQAGFHESHQSINSNMFHCSNIAAMQCSLRHPPSGMEGPRICKRTCACPCGLSQFAPRQPSGDTCGISWGSLMPQDSLGAANLGLVRGQQHRHKSNNDPSYIWVCFGGPELAASCTPKW